MNRWQLTQELFEEALLLAPPERTQRLLERSAGDAELVRTVEALAEADARAPASFERNATELLVELKDEPPAEALCGQSFGPYRVEAHLSSGGMGHVYRATRSSAGIERRVALKVLRPGLDADSFIERFQRERAMLATLEHEHIVAFLDAGTLPDTRPFLVMELVEGVPLTHWGRGRSRTERLALFLQVLSAVQYAHQKLVVHRDLKPSNVLVTKKGIPKLLDFGVAAALDSGSAAPEERAPLTPAYASPEELRGEPATTASDIYSLGVMLGELSGPEDVDLRAIVQKASATEPEARYGSVDRLADDLLRFQAHEPVSARRSSFGYRIPLFLRRQRFPLALVASVILALIVGWVGADLERRDARREAGLGWRAHAQAKLTARIFEGFLAATSAAHPELADGAVAHLEAALREELGEWPETEVLVRMTLADLYLERGERDRAHAHAQRAVELARGTRGLGEQDVARAARLLELSR